MCDQVKKLVLVFLRLFEKQIVTHHILVSAFQKPFENALQRFEPLVHRSSPYYT